MTPDWTPQYVALNNIPITRALCHDDHMVVGRDTSETKRLVTKYLDSINYRPDNFASYFDTAVCRAQPSGSKLCRFLDEDAPAIHREARVLRIHDVLRFLQTSARWIRSGKCADQETAQRRADTCLKCPLNGEMPFCTGCVDLAGRLMQAIGDRRVRGDTGLRACGACGCALRAKVWLPREALSADAPYPDWCWVRAELPTAPAQVAAPL